MKNEKKRRVMAGSLASIMFLTSLSGCSKKIDCSIEGEHAHKYVDSNGMVLYADSERESYYNKGKKQDEYIMIDKDYKKIIDKELSLDLYSTKDNLEYIESLKNKYQDYVEYRYFYPYLKKHVYPMYNGCHVTSYEPKIGYSWTTDPNHKNLTGEKRTVHYVFHGYKLWKNKNGNYIYEKSDYYDNIDDFLENCEYFRDEYQNRSTYEIEHFYEAYNGEYGVLLDYENGPEEDYKLNDEFKARYKDEFDDLVNTETLKYKNKG